MAEILDPYCIAAAFVARQCGAWRFHRRGVKDPAVLAVAAKVRYVIDPDNPYPNNFTGHIRAVMRDSSVIEGSASPICAAAPRATDGAATSRTSSPQRPPRRLAGSAHRAGARVRADAL